MRSKVKAMEKFVTGWDVWVVNSMCLVASYVWRRLGDLLCYRRRHRASTPPAIQVYTGMFGKHVFTVCQFSSVVVMKSVNGLMFQRTGPSQFLGQILFYLSALNIHCILGFISKSYLEICHTSWAKFCQDFYWFDWHPCKSSSCCKIYHIKRWSLLPKHFYTFIW